MVFGKMNIHELKNKLKNLLDTYLWILFLWRFDDSIKDLKKERVTMIFSRSIQRNHLTILCSFVLIIIFRLFYGNPISIIIYLAAFGFMYPFYLDVKFYASYYDVLETTEKMLTINKNDVDVYNKNLNLFQKRYHILRKKLKNKIRSLCDGNFLSYDYEISRISRNIDVFFDSTTRILFKKKLLRIPYSPEDDSTVYLKDKTIDSKRSNIRYYYNATKKSDIGFEEVDFNMIKVFLKYFGDIVIRNPQPESINTIAIGELFRKWNQNIKYLDEESFEETEADVKRYYNEKNEQKRVLFSQIYNIAFVLLIGIISSVIVQLFFPKS
jgi:hypothetical protein